MKKLNHFYVIHTVNGNVISRWDFGEELDKAIDFIHDAMEECYQNGEHLFTVVDELNGNIYYKQSFTMEVLA